MPLGLLRRRRGNAPGGAAGARFPVPDGAGVVLREVLDPVNQPMAAADVTVTELRSHRLAARGATDPYGFFTAVLPPGTYSVLIMAEGLEPHRETIEVAADTGVSRERVWLQSARALELPGGQWLVGAAGLGVIAAGGWIGVRAAMRSYHKHLRLGEMSRRTRRLVDVTGVAGGVARGLVFATAGVFAVRAAIEYEPDKAKGLDDTLRSFADSPAGPALLACVAVGLVLFGLFSFAMARWRKV